MEETKLKPCPFCGGKAHITKYSLAISKDSTGILISLKIRFCPNNITAEKNIEIAQIKTKRVPILSFISLFLLAP